MSTTPASTARVLASRSRLRILRLLRSASEPLEIAQIAEHAGLHANTAREHLQTLVDAGFASAEPQPRASRGRPRLRYRAVDRPAGASYDDRLRERLIALMLASYEGAHNDAEGGDASPPRRQLANLELHFEDLGFDPEVTHDPLTMHFYRCPMMTLAKSDTALVCEVHEDLARAVLAQEPGPIEVDRLLPFVEARHCELHLRRRVEPNE